MRAMGNLVFDVIQAVQLFWLPTKIAINPDIVSDYVFSVNISGSWTHYVNIKATPKQSPRLGSFNAPGVRLRGRSCSILHTDST